MKFCSARLLRWHLLLERHRETECAELIVPGLRFEFAHAHDVRITEAYTPPRQGGAPLQVASLPTLLRTSAFGTEDAFATTN